MKKTLSLLVSLVLLLSLLLVACGETGGGSDDTRVVLELDDYEVIADTYRYYYLSYGMELAEKADWKVDLSQMDGKLRSFTETALCDLYAIYSLAESYDVSLTDSRKEQMEADLAQILADVGGEDAYYARCEAYYMTGDLFRMLSLESEYLKSDLYNYLKDNHFPVDRETVLADIDKNFYRCAQICIFFEDMDYEAARTFIEEKQLDLEAGEHTFSELAYDGGEGTYYTKGYAPVAFENAALALRDGEVSDVIETDVGFHIIKRLPMEQSQIEQKYESLKELYLQRLFTELLAERASSMELARARKHDAVLADLNKELGELIAAAKAAE